MLISIDQFRGTLPRIGSRVLPHYNAQEAVDVNVLSGELRPAFSNTNVTSLTRLTGGNRYNTIYKYIRSNGSEQWLSWTENVDIAKGPIANDTNNRVYFTGLATPRVTDSSVLPANATTISTSNSYKIGVTNHTSKLRMARAGSGTTAVDTRTYVVTYVREWADGKQDESKPSPAAETAAGKTFLDVKSGDTVTLTDIKRPSATDEGNIKKIRIYRSLVGSQGATRFQFAYEFDSDPANVGNFSKVTWNSTDQEFTFTDDIAGESLGEVLPSLGWDTPPDGLKGIVSLNNGVLAGFVGNDIYFSYPYRPHAWPSTYIVTLDYDIVGLGSFGNTIVACTDGKPFMMHVTNPAAGVVPLPINAIAPCVSANSIVSSNGAVFYATPTGVIRITQSTPQILTQAYYASEDWASLNPVTMASVEFMGQYVMSVTDVHNRKRLIYFSMAEQQAGVHESNIEITAPYVEENTDILFGVVLTEGGDHVITRVNHENTRPKFYKWRSKKYVSNRGLVNMSAARVCFGTDTVATDSFVFMTPLNGALNVARVNRLPVNGDLNTKYESLFYNSSLTFELLVDGVPKFTKIVSNEKPFRLPAGNVGKTFEFILSGNRAVGQLDVATSAKELL